MPSEPAAQPEPTFPILSRFFEFWEEVEALRLEVRQRPQAEQAFEPASANARTQLAEVLRNQKSALAPTPQRGPTAQLEQAQYVMAATADELFINMTWNGADDWRLHPLEAELFGTRRAGQKVFERIDRLIDGSDPFSHEMAAVYLTALGLGFKGQYADEAHSDTLEAYERELRKLVGRGPRLNGPLVPQCYEHTSIAGVGLQLPASRIWWWAAVAVVGICLFAMVVVTVTRFHGTTIEEARQKVEASLGPSGTPR